MKSEKNAKSRNGPESWTFVDLLQKLPIRALWKMGATLIGIIVAVFWTGVWYGSTNNGLSRATESISPQPSRRGAHSESPLPVAFPKNQLPQLAASSPKQSEAAPLSLEVEFFADAQEAVAKAALLRERRALRELSTMESGKNPNDLACGVYYFVEPSAVATWNSKPSYISNQAKRFRRYDFLSEFEIHQLCDGGAHVIGFAPETQTAKLTKLSGDVEYEVTLFSAPNKQALSMISVPISRIIGSDIQPIELDEDNRYQVLNLKLR